MQMGVVERSREVMAVMALHEALRNVCINSDWTYAVFWTIRPRPRLRGGIGCKAGDEGSLMLMWEDGYCRPAGCCTADGPGVSENNNNSEQQQQQQLVGIQRVHSSLSLGDDVEEEDPVRKAFRKMSIQLYNYGEGLMGKVASDKCHKWVFRESSETEVGPLNYWQSSFDSHPPEWMDQFSAGIQTIAVIQAGHGLLQLGSCKIVAEDLHFVLRMRYTFESLESQAGGGFMSQTFAPMRNRFFCGSPTGGAAATTAAAAAAAVAGAPTSAVPWQNGHTAVAAGVGAGYFGSSDFRLRLGGGADPAGGILPMAGDENNITSLRLSLQNGPPASAVAAGSFEFRAGSEHEAFVGIKRSASASSVGAESAGAAGGSSKSNLLSRRLQQQHHQPASGHKLDVGSFQELLQGGGSNYSSTGAHAGVFLNSSDNSNTDHGLVVQIPPVIANHSPMISPNKVQRVTSSCISPIIQSALQEAAAAASRPGSTCGSPLAARLSKLTEQQQFTPRGSTPVAPESNSNVAQPFGSQPRTPSSNKESFPMMNNNNGSASDACCFTVDHPEGGGASNQMKPRGDPLQLPAAAWENLKESLEIPRTTPPPPTSGELYPDFMDSFFE